MPFEREIHVAHRQAAHAELAAQVVAGGDAGQHMDGAHRIVRDDAAKLLQFVAAKHLLRGRRVFVRAAGHIHRFRIRACARGDRDGDDEHVAGRHVDEAADEDVVDRRDVQFAAAGGNVV